MRVLSAIMLVVLDCSFHFECHFTCFLTILRCAPRMYVCRAYVCECLPLIQLLRIHKYSYLHTHTTRCFIVIVVFVIDATVATLLLCTTCVDVDALCVYCLTTDDWYFYYIHLIPQYFEFTASTFLWIYVRIRWKSSRKPISCRWNTTVGKVSFLSANDEVRL